MHWLHIELETISTFSLRPSNATSPSGKTLLIPTPYAIKMALTASSCYQDGAEVARIDFPKIRDLEVFIRPPQAIAISRLSHRIQKPKRGTWQQNVISQEYCIYGSTWTLALGTITRDFVKHLSQLSMNISYLGRREGFVQVCDLCLYAEPPSTDFVNLREELNPLIPSFWLSQRMDDMKPDISFDQISRFDRGVSGKNTTRRQYDVLLPYRMTQRASSYVVYEVR